MSIRDEEVSFSFEGRRYPGIIELGFNDRGGFVVSAWTTPLPEPRGRYFTSLPISPLSYRRENPSANVGYVRNARALTISDDWGRTHTIRAARHVLDRLEAECLINEVPNTEPARVASRRGKT